MNTQLTSEVKQVTNQLAANQATLTAPRGLSIQQIATIREVVLSVIDEGCTCDGEKHPWEFYEDGTEGGNVEAFTEDMANEQRLRFCDAIQTALTEREKQSGE